MTAGLGYSRGRRVEPLIYKRILQVLATLVVLLAPFTWSYVGSVGGMLIRAVDVVLLLFIATSILQWRITCSPPAVAFAVFGIVTLLMLRAAVYVDPPSFLAAIKISCYLFGVLLLAPVIGGMIDDKSNRVIFFAALVAFLILTHFLVTSAEIFIELFNTGTYSARTQLIKQGWTQIFSQNLFGSSDALDTRGQAFRNSAGIAFFVTALYFYLLDGVLNRVLMLGYMIPAALLFSRSVWLMQLFF